MYFCLICGTQTDDLYCAECAANDRDGMLIPTTSRCAECMDLLIDTSIGGFAVQSGEALCPTCFARLIQHIV